MCDLRIIQKIRLKDGTIINTEHKGMDETIFSNYQDQTRKWDGYVPPKDNLPGFYHSIPYPITGYRGDIYFDGGRFLKEDIDYDVYEWKQCYIGTPGRWDGKNRKFIPMPELIDKVYTLENK